jgi:hypothetical protein
MTISFQTSNRKPATSRTSKRNSQRKSGNVAAPRRPSTENAMAARRWDNGIKYLPSNTGLPSRRLGKAVAIVGDTVERSVSDGCEMMSASINFFFRVFRL